MHTLSWEVEYTNEFDEWWLELSEEEQETIDVAVGQLETKGLRWDGLLLTRSNRRNTRT
jgi:hypothetical protein